MDEQMLWRDQGESRVSVEQIDGREAASRLLRIVFRVADVDVVGRARRCRAQFEIVAGERRQRIEWDRAFAGRLSTSRQKQKRCQAQPRCPGAPHSWSLGKARSLA